MSNFISEIRYATKVIALVLILFIVYIFFLVAHEQIIKSEIVFYGYLKLSFIYGIFFVLLYMLFMIVGHKNTLKKWNNISTVFLATVIFWLSSYAFIITLPVVIDRSLSVFILNRLASHQTSMPVDELYKIVSEYFSDQSIVQKRIEEQLATGSIVFENNEIHLTKKGLNIAKFSTTIAEIFNLEMDK